MKPQEHSGICSILSCSWNPRPISVLQIHYEKRQILQRAQDRIVHPIFHFIGHLHLDGARSPANAAYGC